MLDLDEWRWEQQKASYRFFFAWTSIDKLPNLENQTQFWPMMQCNNNTQVYHTFNQTLKYMAAGNAYMYLSKQGSWWYGIQLIHFNDRNINGEIVQLSATQMLVIFLEHKGIGTARRKMEQVRKCQDGERKEDKKTLPNSL